MRYLLLDVSGLLHCLVHNDFHCLSDKGLCYLFICSGAVHIKAASWTTFFRLCHRSLAFAGLKPLKEKRKKWALLCLRQHLFVPLLHKIKERNNTCHFITQSCF